MQMLWKLDIDQEDIRRELCFQLHTNKKISVLSPVLFILYSEEIFRKALEDILREALEENIRQYLQLKHTEYKWD